MTAPFPPVDGTQPCAQQHPDVFFADLSGRRKAEANRRACELCGPCPFREACLDYALDYLVDGVWGATTALERKQIRKERGITGEGITGLHDRYELAERRTTAGARETRPLRAAPPRPRVPRRPSRTPPSALSRHIAARHAAGETVHQIAVDRRVSDEAIRYHLRKVQHWAATP